MKKIKTPTEYLASIGRKGGKAKTEKKKEASKSNLEKARLTRWSNHVGESNQ